MQSVARLQEKSGEAAEAPKEIKIFSFEDVWPLYSTQSPPPDAEERPILTISLQMQKLADSPGDIVLIDVREPNELASTGRIPGAINIPVTTAPEAFFLSEEEFEDKFGFERPRKDAEVVFYCRAGVRSKAAAALAQRAGWEKIGEFPGSWLVWAEKGGKVDRS